MKYIARFTGVRLTEDERRQCRQVIRKVEGTSRKVRRDPVLLKVGSNGLDWVNQRIAEAFDCRSTFFRACYNELVTLI
ncbi:MAG: hypothetical protein KatS3mg109_2045 [Pirellulaceae bacterium]|nr:MAG: hypothetical protein KatS3mg109_2045 [Pirellulaceae bacterium]